MDVITIGLKFEYLKDFQARNVEDQESYFFQPFKIKGAILLLFSYWNLLKIYLNIMWKIWLVGNGKRNMVLLFQSL